MDTSYVNALLREREGYERAGRADRVAQVDAALIAAGATPPAVVERAVPEKRTTRKRAQ